MISKIIFDHLRVAIFLYYNMLAALGSLASYALPKLLTFASKKILNTPLGSKIKSVARAGGFEGLGKNIKNNYVKMMNNSYNDQKNPLQNAVEE